MLCYSIFMGILKTNGVHLEDHEYQSIKVLLEKGFNIELIPTSQIKGMRTPDISIEGILWEIKSPTGNSKNTIKHTVQNAAHQASNIIVDLRRCGLPEEQAIKELKFHFDLSRRLKRMMIIRKSEEVLDYIK